MLVHLAFNIYHWGDAFQRRLLVESLAPAVRALREERLLRRFWYAGFDARGPHIFALFSAPTESVEAVRKRVSTLLDDYLTAHPSTELLAPDILLTRHEQCRGKRLCDIDGEAGIAANNSWQACEQAADAFPFRLSAGVADEDALWDTCNEWALWAIDQIGAQKGVAAAIQWTAGLDGALTRAGLDASDYWRYHATTLLTRLEAALERNEAASLAALPASIGEKNSAAFGLVWKTFENTEAGAWPGHDKLVALSRVPDAATPQERWALLRGINHCVLSQLQQPVRLRIPLVLYAWSQATQKPSRASA